MEVVSDSIQEYWASLWLAQAFRGSSKVASALLLAAPHLEAASTPRLGPLKGWFQSYNGWLTLKPLNDWLRSLSGWSKTQGSQCLA